MHLDAIKTLALDIPEGTTSNGLLCPKCEGGEFGHKAMSITRTTSSELKFICFRAPCGYKGRVYTNGNGNLLPPSQEVLRRAPTQREYIRLSSRTRLHLQIRFPNLSDGFVDACKEEDERISMPIKDIFGREVGRNRRGYEWFRKYRGPKSLVDWHEEVETKSDFTWCRGGNDTVYIVEDQLSADCIHNTTGCEVVALLGGHVSLKLITVLKERLGFKTILLALDKDAWAKAYKTECSYRLFGLRALTWDSDNDPKDMSSEELMEVFIGK